MTVLQKHLGWEPHQVLKSIESFVRHIQLRTNLLAPLKKMSFIFNNAQVQPHRYVIKFLFQPLNMTQSQVFEYGKIWGIIVHMPKSAIDKIVSPPAESVLYFYLNTGNKTKQLCNVRFNFYILLGCILNQISDL